MRTNAVPTAVGRSVPVLQAPFACSAGWGALSLAVGRVAVFGVISAFSMQSPSANMVRVKQTWPVGHECVCRPNECSVAPDPDMSQIPPIPAILWSTWVTRWLSG